VSGLVNPAYDPALVPAADGAEAGAFHRSLPGYAPTPVRDLPELAAELGVGAVMLKDESNRFGLPAFKVLGASWAIERTLRAESGTHTLVAASAGNHGRAVAHVSRSRGLDCRVFLPARSALARREAIAGEGADVVVGDGSYEEAVAAATLAAAEPGVVAIADVGGSPQAGWVIDGYATLFAEAAEQAEFDLVIVPVGVGSLAAAAARFAAPRGIPVLGVEPVTAACLTASLRAGAPASVPTPGTSMAGLDCSEISSSAWLSLRPGIAAMVSVADHDVHEDMRRLDAAGLALGDCGAAPLTALRRLIADPELGAAVGLSGSTRVLLVATEGPTDPDTYREIVRENR
jgi:diaminopropionate ammonia-lyase